MRTLILGLIVAFMGMEVSANPFDASKAKAFRIVEFQSAPENRFLPGKPRSRVGEKKAASRAKQAFPNSKILSVNYQERNGSFRVKLLSNGGVVKYIFVDPNDGEVFE